MVCLSFRGISKIKLPTLAKALVLATFVTYLIFNLESNVSKNEIRSSLRSPDDTIQLFNESFRLSSYSSTLLDRIESINSKEFIFNREKFNALTDNELVFIVQVHDRIHYLRMLLESLRMVDNIDQVLIIFSHDMYDEKINKLIESITFCKVNLLLLTMSINCLLPILMLIKHSLFRLCKYFIHILFSCIQILFPGKIQMTALEI